MFHVSHTVLLALQFGVVSSGKILILLVGLCGCFRFEDNARCAQAPSSKCGWRPEAPPALWISALTLLEGVLTRASNVAGIVPPGF